MLESMKKEMRAIGILVKELQSLPEGSRVRVYDYVREIITTDTKSCCPEKECCSEKLTPLCDEIKDTEIKCHCC